MVRRKESSRVCTRPLCGPPLSLRVQLSSAPAWPFLGVAPPRIPNWLCHSRQPHEATVATIDPQTRTAVVGASQAPESSPFLLPLHRQSLGSLSHSAIALGGFFFSSSLLPSSLSLSQSLGRRFFIHLLFYLVLVCPPSSFITLVYSLSRPFFTAQRLDSSRQTFASFFSSCRRFDSIPDESTTILLS